MVSDGRKKEGGAGVGEDVVGVEGCGVDWLGGGEGRVGG